MNPRTLELAQQAGLKKDHASDREYLGDFDWREYGELIVRECAHIAWLNSTQDNISHTKIKEYFGVKE